MDQKFQNVVIESLFHVLPPQVITSSWIEEQLSSVYERLHLPAGRLELMTGIHERRAWPEGKLPSQASTEAAEGVLRQSSIGREAIDLLVHSAVCRDRLEPATASYIHHRLKLSAHTTFFDLSNACLGFLNALVVSASMIEAGQIRSALIVSGENGYPLLENTIQTLQNTPDISRKSIKSFFANLTIGSGAVAAVVCHRSLLKERKDALSLRYASSMSDSSACTLCQGDSEGDALQMQTDSEQLLNVGLDLAEKNWGYFLKNSKWDNIDHTLCHQVGRRHLTLLYQRLGLDLNKDFSTFSVLGNTGSVALPITLSIAKQRGIINSGQKIALLGIGSGLSSIMLGIES